jgi:cation diffusion facilitator CzcD-associated flavoprotein CzcO
LHIESDIGAKVAEALREGTIQSFGKDQAERFLPDYGFGCRRSAPVQDFAASLQRPNVDIVQAGVIGFTETGIVDSNGDTTDVDVCVCATSFHPFVPNFDIVGRDGRNLGHEVSTTGQSYMSIMNAGFPNLFCT